MYESVALAVVTYLPSSAGEETASCRSDHTGTLPRPCAPTEFGTLSTPQAGVCCLSVSHSALWCHLEVVS